MTIAPERAPGRLHLDTPAPTITDPYDPRADSETFDFPGYLATWDLRLLDTPDGRRALTYASPLAFALVYLRHHLESPETGGVTFADCHLDWFRQARAWMIADPGLRGWRRSYASPRSSGKSTMWYLLIPVWAAAHGHRRFIASFADSGTQAEMHLQTFRTEAAHNNLLRTDFPTLCTAVRKPTGRTVADNEGQYQAESGFVWVARGIDTATLGMKVGDTRPDVLIMDDVEKDEARYSPGEVEKRRKTIIDAILPLNERAFVVLVGTVTRPGAINHQLVQVALNEIDPDTEDADEVRWIHDQKIRPHYYPPIVQRPDGTRRSIWPQKWALDYLEEIEDTRDYQKNFANNPRADSGDYWKESDIRVGPLEGITARVLFVDPPVTVKTRSDPCGLVVLGYAKGTGKLPTAAQRQGMGDAWKDTLTREEAERTGLARLSRVLVEHAEATRATGTPLKMRILQILERFEAAGTPIDLVVIEVNQGGDLWLEIMNDLPCKLKTIHSSEPKAVRIGWGLEYAQKHRVKFAKKFPALINQLTAYPKIEHDDIADAMSTGVTRLLKPQKPMKNQSIASR